MKRRPRGRREKKNNQWLWQVGEGGGVGAGWVGDGAGWGGSISHGEALSPNLESKFYCHHYDLSTQLFHLFTHKMRATLLKLQGCEDELVTD